MARRRESRRPWLASLLLLSTPASAFLTLSSFASIDFLAVPIECTFAYETPLRGCTRSDFSSNTCSVHCRLYLEKAEFNVQSACRGVNPNVNTLIYKAQHGMLVDALCDAGGSGNGNGGAGTTTTTVTVEEPTQTHQKTTHVPETTSKVVTHKPHPPKPTSTAPETTSTEKTSTTSSEPLSTSTTNTSTSETPSTTSSPETSITLTTQAAPTSKSKNDKTSSVTKPSETKTDAAAETVQPGSGGGSPGDFGFSGAAPKASRLGWATWLAVASSLMLVL